MKASNWTRSLNATPAWSTNLPGVWKVAKDPGNYGKAWEWFKLGPISEAVDQNVPNPLQLAFPGYNGAVWYWRGFEIAPPEVFDDIRIHFEDTKHGVSIAEWQRSLSASLTC
jgi:hypothetical protein